jgi:cytochrome P450
VIGGNLPTAADAAALTWTTMVLKEAMRLYPSAPFLGRRALHTDRIGEHDVPAGAQVVLSPWVTHRHPGFWDEPERFRLERFAPEADRGRHRYAWFPFGGGPRACIGRTLSLLEGRHRACCAGARLRLHSPARVHRLHHRNHSAARRRPARPRHPPLGGLTSDPERPPGSARRNGAQCGAASCSRRCRRRRVGSAGERRGTAA